VATIAIPAADLLNLASREFILLAGKDGVGKTSALISLADFVSQAFPEATVFVIDTENKFRPTLQSYGTVPPNLVYYQVENMNDVTETLDAVMKMRKPGDWLLVESMGRIWDWAQNLGYNAIAGVSKAEYLERRRASDKKGSPIPKPDDFWAIVKGAHDDGFMDRISETNDLNVVLTTHTARVKEQRANRKESQDRVDFRTETGLDMNLDGAPRLPNYPYTGILLERNGGSVSARIWRDNLSKLDEPQIIFAVPTRKDFAMQFWAETGR